MSNVRYLTREAGMIVSFRGRGSGFMEGNSGEESSEPPHLYVKFMNNDKRKIGEELLSSLLNSVEQQFELALPTSNIEAPLTLPKSPFGLNTRPPTQLLPYVSQQNVMTLTQNPFQPNVQQPQRTQSQPTSQENLLQTLIFKSQYVSQPKQQTTPTMTTVSSQFETLIQPLIMILSQQNWQEKIPPTLFATLLDSIQPLISILSNPKVQERMPPAQKASLKNIIQPLTLVLTDPKWQKQLSPTQLETLKNFIQCLVSIGLYPTAKQPHPASTQDNNKLKNLTTLPQSQAQITTAENLMRPLISVQPPSQSQTEITNLIRPLTPNQPHVSPQVPSTQYETLINLLQSLQTPQKPSNKFETLINQLGSILAERKLQQSQYQNESATLKNLLQSLISQQSQPNSQQPHISMTQSAISRNQTGNVLPDASQLNLPKSNSTLIQDSSLIHQKSQEPKISPNTALLEHNFKHPSYLYSQQPQRSQIQYPPSQQNLEQTKMPSSSSKLNKLKESPIQCPAAPKYIAQQSQYSHQPHRSQNPSQQNVEQTKIPLMNYEVNKQKESAIQCPPAPTCTAQQWNQSVNQFLQFHKQGLIQGSEKQLEEKEQLIGAQRQFMQPASQNAPRVASNRQGEKRKYGYDGGQEEKQKYAYGERHEDKRKYGYNERDEEKRKYAFDDGQEDKQKYGYDAGEQLFLRRHQLGTVIPSSSGNEQQFIKKIAAATAVAPYSGNEHTHSQNKVLTKWGPIKVPDGNKYRQIQINVKHTGKAPVVNEKPKNQNNVSMAKTAVTTTVCSDQQIENKVATTGKTTASVVSNDQQIQNKVATSIAIASSSVDNDQQVVNENTKTSCSLTQKKASKSSCLQPNPPEIQPLMSLRPDLSVFFNLRQPILQPSRIKRESILGEPPCDPWLAYPSISGMPIYPMAPVGHRSLPLSQMHHSPAEATAYITMRLDNFVLEFKKESEKSISPGVESLPPRFDNLQDEAIELENIMRRMHFEGLLPQFDDVCRSMMGSFKLPTKKGKYVWYTGDRIHSQIEEIILKRLFQLEVRLMIRGIEGKRISYPGIVKGSGVKKLLGELSTRKKKKKKKKEEEGK